MWMWQLSIFAVEIVAAGDDKSYTIGIFNQIEHNKHTSSIKYLQMLDCPPSAASEAASSGEQYNQYSVCIYGYADDDDDTSQITHTHETWTTWLDNILHSNLSIIKKA